MVAPTTTRHNIWATPIIDRVTFRLFEHHDVTTLGWVSPCPKLLPEACAPTDVSNLWFKKHPSRQTSTLRLLVRECGGLELIQHARSAIHVQLEYPSVVGS